MNLHEATTSDLMAELGRRCDVGVFIAIGPFDGGGHPTMLQQAWGDGLACVGLSALAQAFCADAFGSSLHSDPYGEDYEEQPPSDPSSS